MNKPTATNTIWHFALAPIPNPIAVASPSSAWDWFFGYEERDDALVWAVADGGPTPADWDSVSLWPSSFDIQPGDSAVGFSFTTPAAPSVVSYYVQGFYITPPTIDEEGFTDPFTLFQNSLTGTIVGPGSAVGVDNGPSSDGIQFRFPIPNPSSSSVSIAFNLAAPASVRIVLYSVSGQLIRVLRDGLAAAGEQTATWDGLDSSSRRVRPGVYYYHLTVNGRSTGQRRVVVLP